MQKKVHFVMLMAGEGSRFSSKGFEYPKPLIEIYGKPFFYWSTQSIRKFLKLASLEFVVLQKHVDLYQMDQKIKSYFPEAKVHALPGVTAGAVITGLKGVEDIEDEYPVLFNDCDHLFMSTEFNNYCKDKEEEDLEGILLTFSSNEEKYSFVGKDQRGNVIGTVEKQVISNEAICGCYFFKNAQIFRGSAEDYLQNCDYAEYFMSGVYNIMINKGLIIKSMKTDFHVPFGTPEEYEKAKYSTYYRELL